jgi:hypothetical protein
VSESAAFLSSFSLVTISLIFFSIIEDFSKQNIVLFFIFCGHPYVQNFCNLDFFENVTWKSLQYLTPLIRPGRKDRHENVWIIDIFFQFYLIFILRLKFFSPNFEHFLYVYVFFYLFIDFEIMLSCQNLSKTIEKEYIEGNPSRRPLMFSVSICIY